MPSGNAAAASGVVVDVDAMLAEGGRGREGVAVMALSLSVPVPLFSSSSSISRPAGWLKRYPGFDDGCMDGWVVVVVVVSGYGRGKEELGKGGSTATDKVLY